MENRPPATDAGGAPTGPPSVGTEAGFDRIKSLLASAAGPRSGGARQRTLLLSVLEEIDSYTARYPTLHRDELRAMREIAAGALVID